VESSNGGFYSSGTQVTTDFNAELWAKMGEIIASTLDELVELTLNHEKMIKERKKLLLEK